MIEFETEISDDDLFWLMKLGDKYGFDPLSSTESEMYFVKLLQEYNGNDVDRKANLEHRIAQDFRSYGEIPVWIQAAEWPFDDGKPMLFIGQMEATVNQDGGMYPNVFYVFWNIKNGNTVTIVQVD